MVMLDTSWDVNTHYRTFFNAVTREEHLFLTLDIKWNCCNVNISPLVHIDKHQFVKLLA